jgi:alpha-galactosidase
MGYNSWYDLGCSAEMNEDTIKETATAYIALGLPKFGYEYVNLDDCWAGGRSSNGTIYPDQTTFPNLVEVIAYVHSLGLKFGVYTDRGNMTCGGRPGSGGYEALDAATYASWGVDFLKEDSCYATQVHEEAFADYALMRDGLNKTGRPIFFDLCGWNDWYAPVGNTLGNEWRIGPDDSNWDSILENINIDANLSQYAGPGGWNNPCLLLGNDVNNNPLITELQSRAQFSMWSILAAPLVLSQNIRNFSTFLYETYTNIEVINVDQDSLGKQGQRIVGGDLSSTATDPFNTTNVWARPLFDGTWAAVFINVGPTAQTVTCDQECFAQMGFVEPAYVIARDLWQHATVWSNSTLTYSTTLPPAGGVQMLQFSAWL